MTTIYAKTAMKTLGISQEVPELRPYFHQRKTFKKWLEIAKIETFSCAICRESQPSDNATLDHIISRDNGGKNSVGNLQVLCTTCHGDKTRLDNALRELNAISQVMLERNNLTKAVIARNIIKAQNHLLKASMFSRLWEKLLPQEKREVDLTLKKMKLRKRQGTKNENNEH